MGGGWGADRDHGSFPGRNNHTHTPRAPHRAIQPHSAGPRYCNAHPTAPPRCQRGGAGRGGAVCAVSGTGQGYLAGATVSPESSRNPVSGHEACWVRGSLAWLFCLICDLLARLGPVHPQGVAELGLPVRCECSSICMGQGGGSAYERGAWPASLGFGVLLDSLIGGRSPVTQQAFHMPLSQRTESQPPTLSPGGRSSVHCRLPLPRRMCSHPLWGGLARLLGS